MIYDEADQSAKIATLEAALEETMRQCQHWKGLVQSCDAAEGAGDGYMPTYGKLPWDQLGRDVMEALTGSRLEYKFPEKMYPGHHTTGINFNSLARIVDKYRLAATPQPAPDAMREAIRRLAEIHVGNWLQKDDTQLQIVPTAARQDIRDFADAVLKLVSAPVPPADGAKKIDDDELTGWARSWHWNDCAGEPADPSIYFRDIRMLKAFIAYCERVGASPSGTGAAEPGNAQMIEYARRLNDIATDCEVATGLTAADWRGHASDLYRIAEQIGRVVTPPVRGDRETQQWPRVFNVKRAENNTWHADISFARCPTEAELQALEIALRDDRMPAPALPVQPGAGEREAIAEGIRLHCRQLGNAVLQNSHGEERIYYSGISVQALAETIRYCLSRQPPQSSREG